MAAFTTSMTRVVALVFLVEVSRPYFQLDRKVHAKQKGLKKRVWEPDEANSTQVASAQNLTCV